jgi:hypothetical protein
MVSLRAPKSHKSVLRASAPEFSFSDKSATALTAAQSVTAIKTASSGILESELAQTASTGILESELTQIEGITPDSNQTDLTSREGFFSNELQARSSLLQKGCVDPMISGLASLTLQSPSVRYGSASMQEPSEYSWAPSSSSLTSMSQSESSIPSAGESLPLRNTLESESWEDEGIPEELEGEGSYENFEPGGEAAFEANHSNQLSSSFFSFLSAP